MANRTSTNRTAVFVVRVPDDWIPQREWHIPPSFSNGELLHKNLNIREARDVVRVFNREAVQKRIAEKSSGTKWDRRWALCVPCIKIPPAWPQRSGKGGVANV
jgi:hypothetical protein